MGIPLGTAPTSNIESMDYIIFTKDNTTRRIKKSELKGYLDSLDFCLDTGTANTYVLTPTVPITNYVAGQVYKFKALNANTGASTISISGVGVKNLVKSGNVALAVGDIPKDAIVYTTYDGTNFQIIPDYSTQLSDVANKKIDKTSIINNLTATVAGSVLDATQGKVLKDSINTINNTLISKATIQSGTQTTVAIGSTAYFDMTGFGIAILRGTGASSETSVVLSLNTINQYCFSTKILDRVDFGSGSNIAISFSSYIMCVQNNSTIPFNFTLYKLSLV